MFGKTFALCLGSCYNTLMLIKKEKKMIEYKCYIAKSIYATEEPHALAVGKTENIEYRAYLKHMVVVHSTSYPTEQAMKDAEKRALDWVKANYQRALVKYGRWQFPNHSPTRTNDWFYVENNKGEFMAKVISLLQEDYND